MAGKAYTMKEMKAIVEYLVEHKAFSEIKGRKMWMDMASSDVTNRTWQSLKETFLKRILPDIHNPYYNLSTHQISSFQQSHDVAERLNRKLEIRSADGDSNTEGDENEITDQVEKNNERNDDIPTGEDLQNLKETARDSTDTIVLENCYATAEDIKRDLQSANEDEDEKQVGQTKSLRDLITYSEPLTSVIQNTIADFATDEEESNGEPQMQIVETEEIAKKNTPAAATKDDSVIHEIIDSDSGKETSDSPKEQDTNLPKESEKPADIAEVESKNKDESSVLFTENQAGNKTVEADASVANNNEVGNKSGAPSEITQNSNTITESLPNNQEAFENKTKESAKRDPVSITKKIDKRNRKRANSQEIPQPKNKKINLSIKKQSISDTDAVVSGRNKRKLNLKKIEKKLNKIDEANKAGNSKDEEKITEDTFVGAPDTEPQDVEMSTEMENPRLKSDSLYEEEMSYSKNKESQKDNDNIKEQPPKNVTHIKDDDIVMLKSHSDSVSDSSKDLSVTIEKKRVTKEHREKALADVFGFSRGDVNKRRKGAVSYHKHSTSHQTHQISSGSSEWTSDTGSEYISPPRGRKNRQTRKYLKPKSARILSLEEEGGLFVMYGKKIYPVVKDGKIIKNYVTYTPEEEIDQEESYWKLKYVEEKKRTDELTKMLKQVNEKPESGGSKVPTSYATEHRISNAKQPKATNVVPDKKLSEVVHNKTEIEDKTVKIKFTKNNEEVQLEGHWSHVNPILSQVMQILQKESNESKDNKGNPDVSDGIETKTAKQKVSIESEPKVNGTKFEDRDNRQSSDVFSQADVEDEIKEKVNKIENDIFKEIEEREREEFTRKKTPEPEENITKRKMRPRKSSVNVSAPPTSPFKKRKLDVESVEVNEEKQQQQESDNKSAAKRKKSVERKSVTNKKSLDQNPETNKKSSDQTQPSEPRKTRSPKKSSNEPPKEIRTRKSLSRKSKEVGSPNSSKSASDHSRYKIPSPLPPRRARLEKNTRKNRYLSSECKVHSPPESRPLCSMDNTQGCQDSDESPLRMCLRNKKRINCSNVSNGGTSLNLYRTNSRPMLTDDITSDSSNSYQSLPVKSLTFQNSTLSSEVYRSESYRLLMNKNFTQSRINRNLENIVESSILPEINEQNYDGTENNDVEMRTDFQLKEGTFKVHIEEDSTSNVSLPTSPVLSIVDNMSISKDLLSSVDDLPVDEKMQITNRVILNDFIKSEADVSMPLMEQECAIEDSGQYGAEYHYNLSKSITNKISTVRIQDPTLTDTINTKFENLILESTKKRMKVICESDQNNNIEIVNGENAENKKKKTGKRSSTPRKRKSSRRLTLVNNEPCIEEHTESCSHSRKSCPAVIENFENIGINANMHQYIDDEKTKSRPKKDIIKVKITKPRKSTKLIEDTISEKGISNAKEDLYSESGILLQCYNDSVDLIHNHSETCLNAHDCMGDSVQVVEKDKSVISLNSTRAEQCVHKKPEDINNFDCELFSNDAQDGSEAKVNSGYTTVSNTPLASISTNNSLITDDLSESFDSNKDVGKVKIRNTKWYLFSEDETSNTNFFDINQNSAKVLECGSNLEEIFPVTCAVPNLSTITEISNQNGEKLSHVTNSRNNFYSPS